MRHRRQVLLLLAAWAFTATSIATAAYSSGHAVSKHQRRRESDTFDAMALQVVPAALQKALGLLHELDSDTGPDDVKPLRKAILSARDALDIFSFAYPDGTQNTVLSTPNRKPEDLWYALRKDLDRGYELIGNFQDLAHSLVEYNMTDVVAARAPCLEWKDKMKRHCKKYGYDKFVKQPLTEGYVQHRHTSKFYWGYNGVTPDDTLSGRDNMARLLHSQLANLLDNFTRVTTFEHVYVEPEHTLFHYYRKLARSILAVLDVMPDLIPTSSQLLQDTESDARTRPFLGASHKLSLITRSKLARRLLRMLQRVQAACDTSAALGHLQDLFRNLGKVNDQVFAVEFYSERGEDDKAEEARETCDWLWYNLVMWMDTIHLDWEVQCVMQALAA